MPWVHPLFGSISCKLRNVVKKNPFNPYIIVLRLTNAFYLIFNSLSNETSIIHLSMYLYIFELCIYIYFTFINEAKVFWFNEPHLYSKFIIRLFIQ